MDHPFCGLSPDSLVTVLDPPKVEELQFEQISKELNDYVATSDAPSQPKRRR